MGDDGEKFGGWPTTFEHCWGPSGWVERFFDGPRENRDWLATMTPSGWLDGHGSIGRVYVPTGSYAEMGEWALPADEAVAFTRGPPRRRRAERRPEVRWLRGAIWRNFQVKYREVNDLHKQMLRASDLVDGDAGRAVPRRRPRPPLRRPVERLLLARAVRRDLPAGSPGGGTTPPDPGGGPGAGRAGRGRSSPGRWSISTSTAPPRSCSRPTARSSALKPDEGAGIGRWDLRAAAFPLAAVMRRRPEAYHEKLRAHDRPTAASDERGGRRRRVPRIRSGDRPASIHDIVTTKQAGLSELLHYDAYERRSGLVRVLPARDRAARPSPTDPRRTSSTR